MSLDAAIAMAVHAHSGQVDKGGQPYILHPLRVMMGMASADERVVAVLHDVVEDSEYHDITAVRYEFGNRIADAVDALTKRKGESYDTYLARVKGNELARAVKIADLKDNCDLNRLGRAPDETDRKRLDKYLRARAILQEPNP